MRRLPFNLLIALLLLFASVSAATAQAQKTAITGVGSTPTQEDLGNLAWTSGPSGKDLPPGKGTAEEGTPLFFQHCVRCHGVDAVGVKATPMSFSPFMGPRLGGGNGVPLFKPVPGRITTMAYFVPWSTAIFNTIAVEMPFFRPGTLKPDEVYSLTAFVLFKNGLIKEDEVMNRETLPYVKMPNIKGFVPDASNTDEILDLKKRGAYGKIKAYN
jgi:S-disulfanyl-L-cysteine oxidoreductase SoxD